MYQKCWVCAVSHILWLHYEKCMKRWHCNASFLGFMSTTTYTLFATKNNIFSVNDEYSIVSIEYENKASLDSLLAYCCCSYKLSESPWCSGMLFVACYKPGSFPSRFKTMEHKYFSQNFVSPTHSSHCTHTYLLYHAA